MTDLPQAVLQTERMRLLQYATEAHKEGRYVEAEHLYRQLLGAYPDDFDAVHRLGVLKLHQGAHEEAHDLLEKAVAIDPSSAAALSNLGSVLVAKGLRDDALARYDAAVALQPDDTDFQFNRGNVLLLLGRYDEALSCIDPLAKLQPSDPEILSKCALALLKLGRVDAAIARYDCVIALAPSRAEAHNNRGNALRKLERHEDALASYDQASKLAPHDAIIQINRSNVLRTLGRFDEALDGCDRAVALAPDNPECRYRRASLLCELKRQDEAIAGYDAAIAIAPDHVQSLYERSNVLFQLRKYEEAIAGYRQVLARRSEHSGALALCAHSAALTCNWALAESLEGPLRSNIESGSFDGECFPVMAVFDDPWLQRQAAEGYVSETTPSRISHSAPPVIRRQKRLRVGYLSADFGAHPVAYLMTGLVEAHDRSFCEVYGFSSGADDGHPLRRRLGAAFDKLIDVGEVSDDALCREVRNSQIDILVDLGGHTRNSRIMALSDRPAPVQISYLGYPGSSGAPFIDYIIADKFVVPEGSAEFFSEKIVYLPDCFQVNDRKRLIGFHTPSRAECGLPDNALVFCGFHNAYKLNSLVFDVWMRLLNANPGSVVWLAADGAAQESLCREAQSRDVDPGRLVFARHMNYPDHLARQKLADLFLDVWPYNGGTTTSDALWAGLPVLTVAGRSYAARMAGSLLHAVGLPELVTDSPAAYEALALKLAKDAGLLDGVRQKLAANIKTAPLFDTDRFRRHIEAAYRHMWDRHQRGEPPATFTVEATP